MYFDVLFRIAITISSLLITLPNPLLYFPPNVPFSIAPLHTPYRRLLVQSYRGRVVYGTLQSPGNSTSSSLIDWVVVCGKNGGNSFSSTDILVDGLPVGEGTAFGQAGSQLAINYG